MMPFIPHTDAELTAMLTEIGLTDPNDLWDEIPKHLRLKHLLPLPEALSEQALLRLLSERAARDSYQLNFIGAGAYEHHIPAAVWDIAGRGEWLTAYTPYQAEASQGTLQMLYEYQTMMADLTGMDAANASLYEGASALAEAALMAVRAQTRDAKRILIPTHIHPHYRAVLTTFLTAQHIPMTELPIDVKTGTITTEVLAAIPTDDVAAIILPLPSFFGTLDDVDAISNWAKQQGLLVVACVNPIAMALLKEPGAWGTEGADIVCGEAQPLGIPLSSGGPYLGFMACQRAYIRQLPGRIVGRTQDGGGKVAYTLTLQAREQHIRRSKATSNICTNQGLAALAATIYMSLLGAKGLEAVSLTSYHRAHELEALLTTLEGVDTVFSSPFFHEFVINLPKPIDSVLALLESKGILGGLPLGQYYPHLNNCLLVNATETKTMEDLERYANALAWALETVTHEERVS